MRLWTLRFRVHWERFYRYADTLISSRCSFPIILADWRGLICYVVSPAGTPLVYVRHLFIF